MTYRQWEKAFRKRLSRLPGEERERALGYYAELYGDKMDAGVSESEIVREFGDPKAAADKIIEESAETASAQGKTVRARTAGDTAARAAAVLLFLFVGLPLLAVLFSLAVAGAALFLSGFAVILAGVAHVVYFLAQLYMYGGAGYVAQIGIGLAAAGVGAMLVPLFLCCTKWLFIACGKIFVLTGRVVRGKREAN